MSTQIGQVNRNLTSSSMSIRIIVATLVFFSAYPLLFFSYFSNDEKREVAHQQTKPAPIQRNNSRQNKSYYNIDVVEYYKMKFDDADKRIKLEANIISFLKNPPVKSNPKLYDRYIKVKSDYLKIRQHRKKIEQLKQQQAGRNQLHQKTEAHKHKYLELEAELFYQLEKIVYFARQSYSEWQIFNNKNHQQLAQFERHTLEHSEKTANLFQDFSRALSQFTKVKRQ